MKELSLEKQIYLCKYHDVDTDLKTTIGLSELEVQEYIEKLKKDGMYEKYRNLDDEEYEKIIKTEKIKKKYEKTKVSKQANNKETIEITTEETKEIKDTYVKISVRTLMNFCYEKRIFR